jgi:hypothetical protein
VLTALNEKTNARWQKCQDRGGCVPGDQTVSRMVRVQQSRGTVVEDYRDLLVCNNCNVPINPWSKT